MAKQLSIEISKTNPILRKKSEPIKEFNADLLSLINSMKITLKNSENGIGLAAPQIGLNIQLFVIVEEIAKDNHTVFINPVITQISKKKITEEEGCLSLPGDWSELDRPDKVTIKALDENGQKFKLRAKGILSRLMLHEVDHLNGILFVDHLKTKK